MERIFDSNEIFLYLFPVPPQKCFTERSVERAVVYPKYVYTDQGLEQSILDNVRAVCLDYLPNEVPYTTTYEMEAFHFENSKYLSLSFKSRGWKGSGWS